LEIQLGVKHFYIFFDGAALWRLVLSTYQNIYKEKNTSIGIFCSQQKTIVETRVTKKKKKNERD